MADNVFNGSDSYVGFIQAYTGKNASVTISKNSSSKELTSSFLVDRFAIGFARNVSTRTFLNVSGRVAMLGLPQGTIDLSGLVGAADDFKEFLGTSDNVACELLTITVDASNGYKSCEGNGNTTTSSKPVKFICSGALVDNIAMGGQSDGSSGISMVTASVRLVFTKLQLASGSIQ